MASYDVVVKLVDQTKTGLRNIETGLTSVQTRAEKVNQTLEKLNNSLAAAATKAAAALTVASGTALRFADSIQDASDATTISTERILAFSQAVAANGGEAGRAVESLLRFSQSIGEAAAGSETTRKALEKVGIGLQELRTLSEEDLLVRAVQGLNGISDASARAAVQADLFGKGLRGVNAQNAEFADGLQRAAEAQRANAENIRAAAQLTDNLKAAYNRLELAILKALKPVIDFVNAASPEQIDRFIDAILKLSAAIVGLSAGIKIISVLGTALGALAGYFALASRGGAGLITTGQKIFDTFDRFIRRTPAFQGAFGGLGQLAKELAGRFGYIISNVLRLTPLMLALSAVAYSVNEAFKIAFGESLLDKFIAKVSTAYNRVKQFLGFGGGEAAVAAPAAAAAPAPTPVAPSATVDRVVEDTSALGRLRKALQETRDEYRSLNGVINSSDLNLAAAAFEKVSAAARQLGIVVPKPAALIRRDFNLSLDEAADKLRQTDIELADTAGQFRKFEQEARAAAQANQALDLSLRSSAVQQQIYNNEIRASELALIDQAQRLDNAKLQQAIYTNEINRASLALSDQQARLRDASLQQSIYRDELARNELALTDLRQRLEDGTLQSKLYWQEIARTTLELQDQQQRLNNTGVQWAIYASEVQRAALALQDQRQRQQDSRLQNELFNQSIEKSRLDLEQQRITLQLLTDTYRNGSISVREYADGLGQLNERLLTAEQLLVRQQLAGQDEVDTLNKKKRALDLLIDNYKTAGGTGTEAFRKTAEALGANATQIDLVVAQYGSFADLVKERNETIKKSILDASSTFVTEFSQAFIQGKSVLSSFANFFTNILNSIAQQLIQQQIAKPIAALLGNFIGSVIPGLADGGIAKSNQAYVVGEAGPELFVPGRTGRVLPNDTLSATGAATGGGEGPLIVNFTIQAVDTQSGVQFLLQNKPVITSMISDAYNRRGRRGPLD